MMPNIFAMILGDNQMAQELLSMKRLREVLRLKLVSLLSNRAIGRAVNISPATVSYYVRAANQAKLDWCIVERLSDGELVETLTPHCMQLKAPAGKRQEPDYALLYHELKKKGVTLQLLHEEYEQRYGKKRTYRYSMFCESYRCWVKKQKPSLRMQHKAGEKCFVDYAGPTIDIIDSITGEVHKAKIFVGVLGASNYTYAEATLTRSIPDWIGSHIRMLNYFGGVPRLIIPDNEKSGVKEACYYDPELNQNYAAFARHYEVSILPTRPAKPKDKPKVENAVLVVERWILARLRHHTFFNLSELNQVINRLLVELNNKPFKKIPGTRLSQFELIDKPVLNPLPNIEYQVATFQRCSVRLDYHIEYDKHHYSVPYLLVNESVECRKTGQLVEIYYQNKRVAAHPYSSDIGKASTDPSHMPKAHRHYQQWTPQAFEEWSATVGTSALSVCQKIIKNNRHPECCRRTHYGFLQLAKRYGKLPLEKACEYALTLISEPRYRSIKSMLQTKIYEASNADFLKKETSGFQIIHHENIRGEDYYQQTMAQE